MDYQAELNRLFTNIAVSVPQPKLAYIILTRAMQPYEGNIYETEDDLFRALLHCNVECSVWTFDPANIKAGFDEVTRQVRVDFANSDYRADFRPADPDWEEPSILWPTHTRGKAA